MMRLLVEETGSGLHPNEAIVAVPLADGGKERLVLCPAGLLSAIQFLSGGLSSRKKIAFLLSYLAKHKLARGGFGSIKSN